MFARCERMAVAQSGHNRRRTASGEEKAMLMSIHFKCVAIGLCAALAMGPLPALAAAATYQVLPGDTLSEIAATYGLSSTDLAARNDLADPDLLVVGTLLDLPIGAGIASAEVSTAYRVQAGDTLEGIAARFGTSVAALLAANPELDDADQIQAGAVLSIATGDHPVAALLRDAANRHGLDPILLQAIAWQESGWQQDTVSSAGATGLLQLRPTTAAWVAHDIVGAPLDVVGSAADNAEAGAALFAWLLERADDEDMALAYYVQGQGSVARDGLYAETRAYIAAVKALRGYIARYGRPPT